MKDVVVLAVDQDITPDDTKPKVVRAVTLEMYPNSALKVLKAANEGKIQLVLRNPADRFEKRKPPKKRIAKARPRKPAKKKLVMRKPKPKPLNVTVIRGTQVNNVQPKS